MALNHNIRTGIHPSMYIWHTETILATALKLPPGSCWRASILNGKKPFSDEQGFLSVAVAVVIDVAGGRGLLGGRADGDSVGRELVAGA